MIAVNLLHRERIDGHFTQGETIQRTHGRISNQFLNHVEVIFFHFAPITRHNLSVGNDKEIHANSGTERSIIGFSIGCENGERITGLSLEEDLAHGTLVWTDVVDKFERGEARSTAEKVFPVVEHDVDLGDFLVITYCTYVRNMTFSWIQYFFIFL